MSCKTSEGRRLQSAATKKERKKMHKKTRETAKSTDNEHPERAFFQKFETFGLGQTNWAEILGGILGISSQTIGTFLAL